jgi:hypothetical protein
VDEASDMPLIHFTCNRRMFFSPANFRFGHKAAVPVALVNVR